MYMINFPNHHWKIKILLAYNALKRFACDRIVCLVHRSSQNGMRPKNNNFFFLSSSRGGEEIRGGEWYVIVLDVYVCGSFVAIFFLIIGYDECKSQAIKIDEWNGITRPFLMFVYFWFASLV